MTNEDRQTVIDALQASLGHLRKVEAEYMTADGQFAAEYAQLNEALDIMRRELEPLDAILRCRYPVCTSINPSGFGWDIPRLNEVIDNMQKAD